MSTESMRDLLSHSNRSHPVNLKREDKAKLISALEKRAGVKFTNLSLTIESSLAGSSTSTKTVSLPIDYVPDALLGRMLSTLG